LRKHYFDNGKALASFLGIVYHSALVFTGADWLISAPDTHSLPLLQIYTEYINLFRMPLFLVFYHAKLPQKIVSQFPVIQHSLEK
jgi:hypothetical protein